MTNIEQNSAVNGYGDPEAGFCLERLMDEAAEKIGMDPVEFRLKNCLRYGSRATGQPQVMGLQRALPGFKVSGIFDLGAGITGTDAERHHAIMVVEEGINPTVVDSLDWGVVGSDGDSLQECIRKVAEEARWKEKWKGWQTPVKVNGSKRTGIGIAIGIHGSSYRPYSAIVKMNQDGTANVMSSATEIGQGLATGMAEVVAETLGIDYKDVNVLLADTAATPAGVGIIGNCGTSSAINAAKLAADDAKQKLFDLTAERLRVKPEDLEAKGRRIYVKKNPEIGISIAEACLLGYQVTGTAVNPSSDSLIDDKTGKVIYPCALAATIAEVEVDVETGELEVLKLISAHDCGRALNPTILENQINVSLTMGSGWVRSEEIVIDKKSGVILNPNMLEYKIMTILDMPKMNDMQAMFVEYPCAWGPYGAKGMSETGTTTPAPAIANAIYNAIGVRVRGDHLTPARILEALGRC